MVTYFNIDPYQNVKENLERCMRQQVPVPTKRTALRMKELKLQPAALMLASAPLLLPERQQNRMASPIIIC